MMSFVFTPRLSLAECPALCPPLALPRLIALLPLSVLFEPKPFRWRGAWLAVHPDGRKRTEEKRTVCVVSLMNDARSPIISSSALIGSTPRRTLSSPFLRSICSFALLASKTKSNECSAPFLQIGTPEKCPRRPRRRASWRTSCPGTTTASSWALKRGPGGVRSRGRPGCSARRGTKVCEFAVLMIGLGLHYTA